MEALPDLIVDNKFDTITSCVEVREEPVFGKHLVASQDILPGQVILNEFPLISGPNVIEEGLRVCLACYSLVRSPNVCSRCQWPVCNAICESDTKHSNLECPIFSYHGVTPDHLLGPNSITILRCLLLKKKFPKKWSALTKLQSHQQKRSEDIDAMTNSYAIATFIQQVCMLEEFDYDLIDLVSGIVALNEHGREERQGALAFRFYFLQGEVTQLVVSDYERRICLHSIMKEIKTLELNCTPFGSYLYDWGSLISHNCIPNCHKIINSQSYLLVTATVPIKKGEVISTSYVESLLGTQERNSILNDTYYFTCSCARCNDPTEMSTFLQAIKCLESANDCSKNDDSYLLPIKPMTEWKCLRCGTTKSDKYVSSLKNAFRKEAQNIGSDRTMDKICKLEQLTAAYRNIKFHRNHFLILQMEYDIVQRLSYVLYKNKLIRFQIKILNRFLELTRKLLSVLDVLIPGCNRHRGRMLYFLQQGLFYLLQYKLNPNCRNRVNDDEFAAIPAEVQEYFRVRAEGRNILTREPNGSEEKLLAQEMELETKEILQMRSIICSTSNNNNSSSSDSSSLRVN